MMQLCRIFERRLRLYRDGAIPDAIWEAYARSLGHTASFPSFGRWWSVQKSVFSDDLQKLVEEAMRCDARTTMPDKQLPVRPGALEEEGR